MRRAILITLAAATLAVTGWAARAQELCANRSPETGARFNFWHPDLVTLHLWLWYPNPDGLYSGTNPYIRPFNHT
jgi:hypothetical protein